MKKNNHKGKRLLAGLLSFLMVATTLPFGGDGSKGDQFGAEFKPDR